MRSRRLPPLALVLPLDLCDRVPWLLSIVKYDLLRACPWLLHLLNLARGVHFLLIKTIHLVLVNLVEDRLGRLYALLELGILVEYG